MKYLCIFIIFISLSFFTGPFGNASRALAGEKSAGERTSDASQKSTHGFAERLISFYRDHLSAVDGDRCPSYPSCSSYSVDAFRKHGFAMGWLMTVDRLIHEGREETAVSPTVYADGKWKIYDPVANNDFWWYHPEQRDHEKK